MAVTKVSNSCLLIELGLICNSMTVPLCFQSCEDHSLLNSYNGGLWKNIYRSTIELWQSCDQLSAKTQKEPTVIFQKQKFQNKPKLLFQFRDVPKSKQPERVWLIREIRLVSRNQLFTRIVFLRKNKCLPLLGIK